MSGVPIELKTFIRDVPDFPKPGIVFKDITPLLSSPPAFVWVIEQFSSHFAGAGITKVVAMESRGFIFGAPIALSLGVGFVPIRKPGKLPWTTQRHEYTLEYGSDALEIHDDALSEGDRVLIVDDVLATGGTAAAAIALVEILGATVAGIAMLMELRFLNGRSRLGNADVFSLIEY
ncbi:MAG TPA: adenine phosphoribosyltransferase [Thermoanaerobaculia bacterium]|nr:adenine phosphoribosyltransferase [Thermoanaerobaculia bacterium]